MPKIYSVTVVLPLYKPSGNWADQFVRNVMDLNAYLSGESIQYIAVHDGPVDKELRTAFRSLTRQLDNFRILHYEENRGKGYALRHGVKAATAPNVLLIDFDFPYEMENVAELLRELRSGKDVAVGRRKKAYFRQAPLKRMIVSKFFSLLNRLFVPLPLFDTQSGIKGFNRFGRSVFLETTIDRFLVDTEFLMRVHKTNLSVGIIDVDLRPHVTFSNFGMGVIQTELANFLRIIRLSYTLSERELSPVVVVQPHSYAMSA